MADVELGDLYTLNRQIRRQSTPLPEDKVRTELGNLAGWCSSKNNGEYYMLLCKEKSDYTIFHLTNFNFNQLREEVKEVLESRGIILGIDYMHGYDVYECWVRDTEDEAYLYMFFNCDDFMVHVK